MVDRSSRPHRSPRRTPTRIERRIIKVRVLRRWGPARIGYLLGLQLAYTELLPDERKDTAAGFFTRAQAWFAGHDITISRVLTDNGSCYRSATFAEALGPVHHKRTRPYRPQTNGKVQRFHRTLTEE